MSLRPVDPFVSFKPLEQSWDLWKTFNFVQGQGRQKF